MDTLQLLVEENHGILLYPGWTNASDYEDTEETFGTVALHGPDLARAMEKIQLPAAGSLKEKAESRLRPPNTHVQPRAPKDGYAKGQSVEVKVGKAWHRATVDEVFAPGVRGQTRHYRVCFRGEDFTSDQRYLCKAMHTPVPILPVDGEAECRLFSAMMRSVRTTAAPDFDAMAEQWCSYVNGFSIFAKLPVYLRTHYKAWRRNQRVKDAVQRAEKGEAVLEKLNQAAQTALEQKQKDYDDALQGGQELLENLDDIGRPYTQLRTPPNRWWAHAARAARPHMRMHTPQTSRWTVMLPRAQQRPRRTLRRPQLSQPLQPHGLQSLRNLMPQ